MPLIPFTRSWREDRKARKESPEIMDVKNREAAKEVEVSPPQTVPIKLTTSNAVMKTQTATESHSRKEKIEKVLEQYGQHDNKGIVGWDAPVSCVLRIELICIAPGHSGIAIVPLRRSEKCPRGAPKVGRLGNFEVFSRKVSALSAIISGAKPLYERTGTTGEQRTIYALPIFFNTLL